MRSDPDPRSQRNLSISSRNQPAVEEVGRVLDFAGVIRPDVEITLNGRWLRRAMAGRQLTNEFMAALVGRVARERDREAFAELFRFFAPRLKGFGMRRGVEAAAAEELAQETMLAVWRKAETFDPAKAVVSTWIFTIIRNKRIDLFRREGFPEAELSEIEEYSSNDDGPEQSVDATETEMTVRDLMKDLPAEQLQIIKMAFYEEKSHSVIAGELNLPLGTVKSRIRLALSRMRTAMPEDVRP